MDNSLSSSSSEANVSGLKSVFKKPTDFYQAFEVSLEESVTAAQSNKSEPDYDISSGTLKSLPFKKSRKSIQEPFNVSLNDSAANSELEQSVTFAKPQSVFKKKAKTLVDFFNVSYNETNTSVQVDVLSKSTDDSNVVYSKKNPFKKSDTGNGTVVYDVPPCDENDKSSLESQEQPPLDVVDNEADNDSTTFATKENPFKKASKQKSDSETHLELSVTAEDETAEPENDSNPTNTSKLNNEVDSSISKTKLKIFERRKSSQNSNSVISITEQRSNKSLENGVLTDAQQTPRNISLDRSISKVTNNTASFLEQSSINDENLNNWMSDHSDEEMPPPRIPSVTANLSHTKEKPAVPDSPTVERAPLSIWEQKFNEIVSNAEKKHQSAKSILNLKASSKPKHLKKPDVQAEKPGKGEEKYKPPKLIKPASFATKRLYNYIIKRLEPKYGIDTIIESEKLVLSICDTVKKVNRRKSYQKRLIQNLKKEMAEAGLIDTTMDFYEFVIEFLPYSFRVKVVPCLQPVTNVVYPPKDVMNPFDKIL